MSEAAPEEVDLARRAGEAPAGSGAPAEVTLGRGAAPRTSIVVPAFDEAANMPDLFSELAATIRDHGLDAEIVLVDDGSTDGTYEAASAAAASAGLDPHHVTLLRHARNLGKTEALETAARHARGEYLVLFDADLQHATDEIPRFVSRLDEGYDLVAGRKVGDYDKKLVSGVYNRLSQAVFRVPARDLNSMKAFRRGVLHRIRLRHDWHRYLTVLAHHEGARIGELDIELHPRRHGEPKYGSRGRIVVGTLDMLSVWFQTVFGRKPMLFFGVTGLGLIGLGGLVGLVALYLRFVLERGYRPLLTLVLLLVVVGVLLFILGFLAEMIASLRDEVESLKRERRD